uniref:Uncharacterized protein n=1 Tax=Oryza brachyantha TaxID=4533 RepID=J3MK91_ORYBR
MHAPRREVGTLNILATHSLPPPRCTTCDECVVPGTAKPLHPRWAAGGGCSCGCCAVEEDRSQAARASSSATGKPNQRPCSIGAAAEGRPRLAPRGARRVEGDDGGGLGSASSGELQCGQQPGKVQVREAKLAAASAEAWAARSSGATCKPMAVVERKQSSDAGGGTEEASATILQRNLRGVERKEMVIPFLPLIVDN